MLKKIQFSLLLTATLLYSQTNPMDNERWNVMNANRLATTFNNAGMLCNGNNQSYGLARLPSFEFPQGSGYNYGTCVAVVVGAPFGQHESVVGGVNPEKLAYLDGTMDEGPADFWNEEHFAPYPEFVNPSLASVSSDPDSWPASWPDAIPNYIYETGLDAVKRTNSTLPTIPLKLDPATGWPGFGENGEQIADLETFSVMYGWGGTDQIGSANPKTRWLRTQMIMRGLQWQGSLYENFIVWVFIIRNPNSQPIVDMAAGIHVDYGVFPAFIPNIAYDDDRHYYDPQLQLAYTWDDNDFEENPVGGGSLSGDQLAWAGVVALEMPGPDKKVHAYDAVHFWEGQTTRFGSGGDPEMYFRWNLLNLEDPHDSDGDGIDDDFDGNGVPDAQDGGPNYYIGTGADGLQVMSSGQYTLEPGQMDTLIFATVFGTNEDDLKSNAQRAIALYQNDWVPISEPPEPTVEAFAGDRKVTVVWGTNSEQDPQFQGYKVYRSIDNGQTWGSESFTDFIGTVKYVPLAQYDLADGIKDYYQTLPEFAWYFLGEDSWVPLRYSVEADTIKGFNLGKTLRYFEDGDSVNVFVDRDVLNGVSYSYYVASYDSGNGIWGPLENIAKPNPADKNNTVRVTPTLPIAANSLDEVRVVPNPYIVSALWETGFSDHRVQFTGMPGNATISIFNSSSDLVKTIQHDALSSIVTWNLRNEFNQLCSPGVYFYYIKSALGEKKGKFIIIL